MGLFSRTKPDDENENFDDIELPSSSDIKTPDEPNLDFKVRGKLASHGQGYGIEDAIRLMKSLPRDNNDVVVTVVKKTLESTNIQIQDIISDASAKEERIRGQHKRLEKEIKNFQEQIAQRNQRISDLLQDLKDTTDVRQRLQLGLELDTKSKGGDSNTQETKTAVPKPALSQASVNPGQVRTVPRPQTADASSSDSATSNNPTTKPSSNATSAAPRDTPQPSNRS